MKNQQLSINKQISKKETELLSKEIQDSLALLYHENSKIDTYSARVYGGQINSFLYNPYYVERSNAPFKCYHDKEKIDLSSYKNLVSVDTKDSFTALMAKRKSSRNFDPQHQISLYEVFCLLHHSYGVTYKEAISGYDFDAFVHHRNVPSGGGLYPLEIYIAVFKGHLEKGIYHFRSDICALELIKAGDFSAECSKSIGVYPYINIKEVSLVVFTTGIFQRSLLKYGDRGYRFILQEAGSVAFTMSIVAHDLNLSSCQLGGYLDDEVNNLLGIDGYHESILNVQVFGGTVKDGK
ncbi:MAG: SagB family peptide dehydrogenase [Sphingobacteriaceae bacterium]|nr:SagB family peptide dehydrogenase [Sphingobacteriaceae bacterium]